MRSTLVDNGSGEKMEDVDPYKLQRMGSTLHYKRCVESLKRVDISRIHPMRSTLVYRGGGNYFGG